MKKMSLLRNIIRSNGVLLNHLNSNQRGGSQFLRQSPTHFSIQSEDLEKQQQQQQQRLNQDKAVDGILRKSPSQGSVYAKLFARIDRLGKIEKVDHGRWSFESHDSKAIIDKEQVQAMKEHRDFPDIQPGYTIQLKVEVPENKRRVSTMKGTVIARRNSGLQSTFRIRRMVAGVGIESLFPLYSPSIKEMQVLNKNKTRRAKPYYLRDRKNAFRKQ